MSHAVSELLRTPRLHARFATSQGDAAMAGLRALLKLHHDPHPWDDLWREIAVEHPLRDQWWEERSMIPFFDRIQIPAYLGCDWENVPLHLPGSLAVIEALLAWLAASRCSATGASAGPGRACTSRPWPGSTTG